MVTKRNKVVVYDDPADVGPFAPPDYKQCEVETVSYQPFTLGAPNGRVVKRCEQLPVVIATEVKATKSGHHGAMSLCFEHQQTFQKEFPDHATYTQIARDPEGRAVALFDESDSRAGGTD